MRQAYTRMAVTLRTAKLRMDCHPRRPVLADWSRPIYPLAGSTLARMSRYSPAEPGTPIPQPRLAPAQNDTSRHYLIQFSQINRMQELTLNPRVRDSSPWRRTRTDLGFYRFRSFFMCRFVPMLAPCSLASEDRVVAGMSNLAGSGLGRRRLARQLSRPMVYANDHEGLNGFGRRPASCPAAGRYRRLRVTWVTPLGLFTASMWNRSSSPSRPSQSRSPRPSTIGTTTMCR